MAFLAASSLLPGCATASSAAVNYADSVQWLRIRTEDGVLLAAVARPQGPGPFPALVILHGTHGFAEEYVQLARDMAQDGVLGVAVCWFTGHKGVGERFVTPIDCPDGPPFVDADGTERFRIARRSIDSFIDSLRARPDVNKNDIALFGHSRGGGAALDYVLLRTGKVRAVILNSTGYPAAVTGRAAEVNVPLLIMHGTADDPRDGGSAVTNVEMARKFVAAVRRMGKPVEAKYYNGSGHNALFSDTTQYRDAVRRIAAFLRRN